MRRARDPIGRFAQDLREVFRLWLYLTIAAWGLALLGGVWWTLDEWVRAWLAS